MESFITDTEWACCDKFDGRNPILKWAEVEQMKRFSVISIEENPGRSFQSYIIHFADMDDNPFKCYAPSHFIKQIRANRQMDFRPYFVSCGHVEVGNKQIAKFEIVYKKLDKSFDLFVHNASPRDVQH